MAKKVTEKKDNSLNKKDSKRGFWLWIILLIIWITFLAVWFLFFAKDFTIYQNIGIALALIAILVAVFFAIRMHRKLEYKYGGQFVFPQ